MIWHRFRSQSLGCREYAEKSKSRRNKTSQEMQEMMEALGWMVAHGIMRYDLMCILMLQMRTCLHGLDMT